MQVFLVPRRWANAMIAQGLVCFIAWHHYSYMTEIWQQEQRAPTTYRYMDWLVTVPLQILQFWLILKQSKPQESRNEVPLTLLFTLYIASQLMIVFGYLGESEVIPHFAGFTLAFMAYMYIAFEVFFGSAAARSANLQKWTLMEDGSSGRKMEVRDVRWADGSFNTGARGKGKGKGKGKWNRWGDDEASEDEMQNAIEEADLEIDEEEDFGIDKMWRGLTMAQQMRQGQRIGFYQKPAQMQAFELIRIILTAGWAMYPTGFVVGYFTGEAEEKALNSIYNIADLVNKFGFGFAVYIQAQADSMRENASKEDYIDIQKKALTSIIRHNNKMAKSIKSQPKDVDYGSSNGLQRDQNGKLNPLSILKAMSPSSPATFNKPSAPSIISIGGGSNRGDRD